MTTTRIDDAFDDYLEFNHTSNGSAWIEIHNPWAGDTNSGFGVSAQISITPDKAVKLGNELLRYALGTDSPKL